MVSFRCTYRLELSRFKMIVRAELNGQTKTARLGSTVIRQVISDMAA